jgi:hypothetical protein
MKKRITLELPNELISRALEVAGRSQRDLEDVLAEWLDRYVDDLPVEALSDNEVLSLCRDELNPIFQYELRSLLYHHRERGLTGSESQRMDELLQIYRRGIIRKARAMEVAAARGLQDKLVS